MHESGSLTAPVLYNRISPWPWRFTRPGAVRSLDRRAKMTPQGITQLVAGILCLVLVGIVVLRRKRRKKDEDEP